MGEYYRQEGPEGGHHATGALDRDRVREDDLEAIKAVLERPRRRVLLDVVSEHGPVTKRDLAIQIGARIHDVAPRDVTEEQRQRLTIALHHVDVPKLVATGVLVAEGSVDRLRLGPKAELVQSVCRGVAVDRDEFDAWIVEKTS